MAYLFQRSGGEFVANTVTAGDQLQPKVIKLASGGFLMVWVDLSQVNSEAWYDVRAQIFDAAGNKVGGEILVNVDTLNFQSNPDAVGLPNGNFVIAWESRTGNDFSAAPDIKVQIFDAAGARIGGEFTANTDTAGSQFSPKIAAMQNGGFAIIWGEPGLLAGQLFDSAGAAVGAEFTFGASSAGGYAFTALTGGGMVATWGENSRTIKIQMFGADGAKSGSEITVDVATDAQFTPSVGALTTGGFVVSWTSYYEDGYGRGIKAQMFDAAGNEVGGEFVVNTSYVGEQDNSSVVGLPGGGFLISWNDNMATLSGSVVRAQAFNADGTKSGAEFQVHQTADPAGPNHNQPSLALLDSGDVVVAWHGSGPGDQRTSTSYPATTDGGIRVQLYSLPASTPLDIVPSKTIVSEIAVEEIVAIRLSTASAAVNGSYTYSLLSDSTGGAFRLDGDRLVVADSDKLDFETASAASVTVRVTDHAGNSVDEVIQLSIANATPETRYSAGDVFQVNTQTRSDQKDAAIADLASGGFVIVWTDGDFIGDGTGSSVKAQLYDGSGNPVGDEFRVNTSGNASQERPTVTALASGGFAVSWNDQSGSGGDSSVGAVKAQIFDAAGAKLGAEFLVNTTTAGLQAEPSIVELAGGGFVISWMDTNSTPIGYEIRAQRFDAAGARLDGEIAVNTATASNQTFPSSAALAGGGFVVSWTDASLSAGDTSGTAIRAQMFDAAGVKVGGEFLVNTTTSGSQSSSAAAALGTGFVIVWQDGGGIQGQIFDAAGGKVGGQIAVDTVTQGFTPAVAATPSGGFIVTWTAFSALDDSGTALMAQLFDAAGAKLGDEFLLAGGTDSQEASAVAVLGSGAIVAAWSDGRSGGLLDLDARILASSDTPVARNDGVATDEASALAGNVLADNGSGADGGLGLQVTAVNGSAVAVGQQISLASGALLTLNANGTFNYDPNGAFAWLVPAGHGASSEFALETFTYSLAGGSTATVTVQVNGLASAGDQYRGSDFNDEITGTTGADLFLIHQASYDIVHALAGDDVIYVGGNLFEQTQIDGGDGYDVIQFQNSGGGPGDVTAANLVNVEELVFLSSRDDRYGRGDPDGQYGYNLVFTDATLGTGRVLTIDASDLLFFSAANQETLGLQAGGETDARFIVTGGQGYDSLVTGGGADVLLGGGGDDALNGGGGDDLVEGGAGNDLIYGSPGANLLEGGTGDDHYVFVQAGDTIVELAGEGTDEISTELAAYTLAANVEKLTGLAFQSGQALTGNDLANLISGSGGNDILDGAGGADELFGYDGNDVYIVGAGDTVTEYSGGGSADEIRTALASYAIGATDVEKLTGTSGAGQTLTGNALANIIAAGAGADVIDGGLGADSMAGGLGNDVYIVDDAADSVTELFAAGSDEVRTALAAFSIAGFANVEKLTGLGSGGQSLTGNGSDNVIDGGLGADAMAGGLGNDVFLVDNAGDTVSEGEEQGVDEVRTTISFSIAGFANVENLTGGAGDQTLTGNGYNNVIDGGTGADAMAGGGGHDVYIVDNLGDTVTEADGAGIDEVRTNLGSKAPPERAVYVLPNFIENLTGTAAGAQGVRDNALNNVIVMGNGHDLVVADAGGVDTISGGAGNDFVYHGDKLTAADVTNGGAGTDTISLLGNYGSGITFTATNLIGVERMALYTSLYQPGTGPNNYTITMNDANVAAGTEFFVTAASLQSNESLVFNGAAETNGRFTVHGGGGADTIIGGAGGDFIIGNAGNDTLYGLGGTDFLIGGLGADQLRGGAGADRFVYQSAAQSTTGNVDRILDFQHVDRIDLSTIDANGNGADGNSAFTFIGANAFGNVAGQLRAYQSGADWFVEGDVNGDGLADLVIQVTLPDATPLGVGDFIL